MTKLTLFSKSIWISGISKRDFKFTEGGVKEWISHGGWSLSEAVTSKKAKLIISDQSTFSDAVIADAFRMASAAFESAQAVGGNRNDARSCAWQLISYYYAAYFSANALMRMCGEGCINLTSTECVEINEMARLYGVGGGFDKNKLSPGVYYLKFENNVMPTCELSVINSKGGVHIQFWTGFLKFLSNFEKSIVQSRLLEQDKRPAKKELGDLQNLLTDGGRVAGGWLSEVRNSLNYRLAYGMWFPYSDSETDGDELTRLLRGPLNGSMSLPSSTSDIPDPERAAQISGFLLSWLKESLDILEGSFTGSKAKLVRQGALGFAAQV